MARKNLLEGLMSAPETKSDTPAPPPRSQKGAIGAVSKSIADLKSRSVTDIDPNLIDAGGFKDRLGDDREGHAGLVASIKEYGQQVPVLVRPHPDSSERYQIVYGRRRLAALQELGLPVKAMIRDLDDDALVMAQGQENTARRDLSFIEKALFASQMEDAGYARKAMCDALTIDKTVISRMLAVIDKIPVAVIEMIGAAHGVGRDRWVKLSEAFGHDGLNTRQAKVALNEADVTGSDARFEVVFKLAAAKLSKPKPKRPAPSKTPLKTKDGTLGQASWSGGKLTMTLDQKTADGFDEWLVENLEKIHTGWKASRGYKP